MYVRIACALSLIVASSFAAYAMDFIHRKPGLWSITTAMKGMPAKMGASKMCIDANTDAELMRHGMKWDSHACTAPAIAGAGPVRTVDMVCHIAGATQKSHIVMTFSGDASYRMDMTSKVSRPNIPEHDMHLSQDAKWMGACPAGMKPGDMTIGGMTVNVLHGGAMAGGHMTREQIEQMIKAHQH